ncbi:unnamed protein product [Allacma fusca]|uniref:Uncharacterized protein n=1 Tax=Allacma fusca TaxID=39272 RepID=A0A8J2JZ86_9HEXA|nr:unnamed protein product [Allacma fusca]
MRENCLLIVVKALSLPGEARKFMYRLLMGRGTSVVEFSAETPSAFFDPTGENAARNGLALHRQAIQGLTPGEVVTIEVTIVEK